MAGERTRAIVTDAAVDIANFMAEVADDGAGAVVTFQGVVRNHDAGEAVEYIDYHAHPDAQSILEVIVAEIAARPGVHRVACVHRWGHLEVGQTAMVAAVSASHRHQAFSAVSDLVDEVKLRLPIWKKQGFSDGQSRWSGVP